MSALISKHFLLTVSLLLPLLQSLIQICFVPFLPSQSLYSTLNRISRLFGFFSLGITVAVLGIFWSIPAEEGIGILHYHLKTFAFRFSLTTLGIVFWSAKNIMAVLIERFSIRYLFREPGIEKFYFMVSIFSFSLNLVFFSDSFAPFTLGWELMGLASVMLIAFFDHRRVTVERSFLTFLFYKLGDFFLLTALLYIANTTPVESFSDFRKLSGFHEGSLILCLFALSAFVKSGLLPFSFWLPRSMEGPTPSSALFYGGLSSHAGAFLLLRIGFDSGGIEGIPSFLILFTGTATALFAYLMALTRTDVKSQIIYSTLCQISVIFIEIALGWITLALFHSVLHMFFRLFQFLIAPSAIYLAHEKDFLKNEYRKPSEIVTGFRQKWLHLIWWLCLHEFGLAIFWRRFSLAPLLFIGQSFSTVKRIIHHATRILPPYLRSINPKNKDIVRYLLFLTVVSIPVVSRSYAVISISGVLLCQIIALGFSLISIEEKKLSNSFFNLIFSGTFLVISYYYSTAPEHVNFFYTHLIVTSLGFSLLGGLFIFFRNAFDLPDGHDFFGLYRISPFLSAVFAVLILFVLGFPGFSTYFSFELMSADLSRISALAAISGLAVLNINAYLWFNIYTRLFWGKEHSSSKIHLADL